MMNEAEKDRRLLENLDRLLTGRESEIQVPPDEDSRTALDFARKMASLREKPSREFRDNLKAQLIHRLAEQENKERSRDRSGILWEAQHPVLWRWTIAAFIVAFIAAVILLVTLFVNRAG